LRKLQPCDVYHFQHQLLKWTKNQAQSHTISPGQRVISVYSYVTPESHIAGPGAISCDPFPLRGWRARISLPFTKTRQWTTKEEASTRSSNGRQLNWNTTTTISKFCFLCQRDLHSMTPHRSLIRQCSKPFEPART
jgi:hypothetical protein